MGNTMDWKELGVACGALIALGTILGWTYRRVIKPMWGRTIRSWRRVSRGADDLLGKPAEYDDLGNITSPEVTSLRSEIIAISQALADQQAELVLMRSDLDIHVQWHPAPGGRPAGKPRPQRNGIPST